MASRKEYVYQIKGSKIAILEKDVISSDGLNYIFSGTSGDGLVHGSNSGSSAWKSPISSVADGLEIEYVYSPEYFIDTTNDVDENITQYQSTDGYLSIADNTSAYINYATTYALATDSYIVLRNAGRFNGLHKIKALSNNTGTNNKITLYTKYSGSEAAWTNFEEAPKLYYSVNVLNNESDEIDLPLYLTKALVLYVKAKIAEDGMNIEAKEYLMKEFRKMLEKHESGKIWGSRQMMPGTGAIR
jgi:hypothetical protein|tara:strand:+ start:1954 stop:2685 length:732 start_codon:yes stop_codon:yes gene_type:complete